MLSANLKRRSFLTYLTAFFGFNAVYGNKSKKEIDRPNIIYIMADDLGWADLSCYGRDEYKTPNLDKLASNGLKFTQAYSASSVCTPTRCAFNTGRYPSRNEIGLREPLPWKKNIGDVVGLPSTTPTLASLLKKNNYYSILVGKWHLGYLPTYSPIKSGFDDFFGIMSGGGDYFSHKDALGEPDLFEDETPVEKAGYITDLITNRAVEFISGKHEKPFFLSLNYTAPHWPWEGPMDEEKSKTLKSGNIPWTTDGGSLQTYASMMASLDQGIGKVMEALRSKNLEKNTLVIFTSDNGGERFSQLWPFSGQKMQLLEGGLRVPAIVYWKGIVKPGVTDQVAITMDWTATILAATNTAPDTQYPLDGEDLLPLLKGNQGTFERNLFWRMRNQDAVRKGKWKYYKKITTVKECSVEDEYLFDLEYDPREQTNFKEEFPAIFEELKEEFAEWNKGMLPYPPA